MAAGRDLGRTPAIADDGLEAHAYVRFSPQRLDNAYEHHRPEHASKLPKPWTEIDDPNFASVGSGQPRLDDGGIAPIALALLHLVDQVDGENALSGIAARAREQRTQRGVRIRPRQASPDDATVRIEQAGHLAITDHREIERCRRDGGHGALSTLSNSASSQRRTAKVSASFHGALTPGPTAMEIPPRQATA